MAFELDDDELIATRVNNKAASWKEVEEYIEKYYVRKDKIREKIKELDELLEDTQKELGSASIEFTIYAHQNYMLKSLLEE